MNNHPEKFKDRWVPTTLSGLKRWAKQLKKEQSIPHTDALERIAELMGYGSYKHALDVLGEVP